MLGPFRIRNLRRPGSPPNRQPSGSVPTKVGALEAVVCLTGREYQSNALNHPESRLRYLDEDDGETVTVGTSTELSCRLSEPVPRYAKRSASSGPTHLDVFSNAVTSPISPTTPDMHVFEIDRRGDSVRIWEEIEQRTVQLQQKPKFQGALPNSGPAPPDHPPVMPMQRSGQRHPTHGDDDLSVQVDPSDDICRLQEMQSDDIHQLQKAQREKGLPSEGCVTLNEKQREDMQKLQFLASNPPQLLTNMMAGEESNDVSSTRYAPFEVEEETLAKEDTPLLVSFHEGNLTTEGKRQAIIAGIQLRDRTNPIRHTKSTKELRSESHEKNRWASYVGSKTFSAEKPVTLSKIGPSHIDGPISSEDQQGSLLEVFQAELAKISRPPAGVTEQQEITSGIEVPHQTLKAHTACGTTMSIPEPLSEAETRQQLLNSMVALINGINLVASGLRNQVMNVQGQNRPVSIPMSEAYLETPQNVINSRILKFESWMREATRLCERGVDFVQSAVGKSGKSDLQDFRATVKHLDFVARGISTMGSDMSSVRGRDDSEGGNRCRPPISPSRKEYSEESRSKKPNQVEAHVTQSTSTLADNDQDTSQSQVKQEVIAKEVQELAETVETEKLWTMGPNPYQLCHAELMRSSDPVSRFTNLPRPAYTESSQIKTDSYQTLPPLVKLPSVRFADSPTIPTNFNHGPSTLPPGKAYRDEPTITYRHIPNPMPHESINSHQGRQLPRVSPEKPYHNQRRTYIDSATTLNLPEQMERNSTPALEYRRGSRSRSKSPNSGVPRDAFGPPQFASSSRKPTFPQSWDSNASMPFQSGGVHEESRGNATNVNSSKRFGLVERDTTYKRPSNSAFNQESSIPDFQDSLTRGPNVSVSEQELLDHMENPTHGRPGHLGPSLRRWRSYHPTINEGLRTYQAPFPGPLHVPRKQQALPAEPVGLRHSFSMSAIRKPRPLTRKESTIPYAMTVQEDISTSSDSRGTSDYSINQSRSLIEEHSEISQRETEAPVSPLVATRFPTLEQFEGSRNANMPSFPALPSMEPLVPLRHNSSKAATNDLEISQPGSKFARASDSPLPKVYDSLWPHRTIGPEATESSGDFFKRMTGIGEPSKKPNTPVSPVQLGPAAPGARLVGPFDPLAETAAIHRHQLIEGIHRSNTVATSNDRWTTRNRRPYSDYFSGNGRIGWDHFVGRNQRGPSDWASARERERLARISGERGRPSRVKAAATATPARIAADREEAFAPAHGDPSTVSKVQSCVEQLKDLGFGRAEDGGVGRLVVYAQAANGDLEDAIDMIDEERKAYEGRVRI